MKDKEEVGNIFNNFFVNIVPTLGIKTEHEVLNTTDNSQDPIENAICKYENHPSIIFAKKHIGRPKFFPCFWDCHKRENWKTNNELKYQKGRSI